MLSSDLSGPHPESVGTTFKYLLVAVFNPGSKQLNLSFGKGNIHQVGKGGQGFHQLSVGRIEIHPCRRDHAVSYNGYSACGSIGSSYRHTGYPGGLKEANFSTLQAEKPEMIIEKAVKGMLPKNRLGRAMAKKLKVYAGPAHPHEAQKPQPFEIKQVSQ